MVLVKASVSLLQTAVPSEESRQPPEFTSSLKVYIWCLCLSPSKRRLQMMVLQLNGKQLWRSLSDTRKVQWCPAVRKTQSMHGGTFCILRSQPRPVFAASLIFFAKHTAVACRGCTLFVGAVHCTTRFDMFGLYEWKYPID